MALVVLPQEEKAANKNTNQVISGGAISYSAFTLSKLVVFAGVFALLGGYWLFSSFALGPQLATIESEEMVLPANASIVTDASASGGRAVQLTTNGKISKTFSTTSAIAHINAVAKSNTCKGASATMQVLLDNVPVLLTSSIGTAYKSFGVDLASPLAAGSHSLEIVYTNSYTKPQGKTCNRNLTVDVSNLYGADNPPPPPPIPTVALTANPSNITSGQSTTLSWNSTNATSCSASSAWGGIKATSGSETLAPTTTSTYTLSCTGSGGTASVSATVNVSSGFNTSLTNGMTITPPYTWTFSPGETAVKGYFWADGNLLATVDGPGPYTFTINSSTLTAGTHQLGHAWDTPSGAHKTPPSSYGVTVNASITPPPPPASGTVKFRGDWETANVSPWTGGVQCRNYTGVNEDNIAVRGTLNLVTDTVAKGNYAARFDLPPSSGKYNACEALRKRTLELSDEWYSVEVRFPSNVWSTTTNRLDIAQLNYQGIWGAPAAIIAKSNTKSLRFIMQSGHCSPVGSLKPGCTYNNGDTPTGGLVQTHAIPASALTLGVWHQLLVHINWKADNSGLVEVFHRERGATTWTQTVKISGVPTVQWKDGYTPTEGSGTNDKIGGYRAAETQSVSVWHDNFCVGTTRSSAESCF